MKRQLRVLVLEDSEFDAQVMISLLRRAGYDPFTHRVETAEAGRDKVFDRAAEEFVAAVVEEGFGLGVDKNDSAVAVDHD